ncbi:hypothetical protein HDU96_004706, partial [Phlyctochytrium bullatum]
MYRRAIKESNLGADVYHATAWHTISLPVTSLITSAWYLVPSTGIFSTTSSADGAGAGPELEQFAKIGEARAGTVVA